MLPLATMLLGCFAAATAYYYYYYHLIPTSFDVRPTTYYLHLPTPTTHYPLPTTCYLLPATSALAPRIGLDLWEHQWPGTCNVGLLFKTLGSELRV